MSFLATMFALFVMFGFVFSASLASADALPEGYGLSARYPGDVGIGDDPAVLLHEDFESGDLADLKTRWSDISNKGGRVIRFVDDAPPNSAGRRALQMTATRGENTGGHLYTRFEGQDVAFARFYVKFAPDAGFVHHFVHLGGYEPSTPYPQGGAGIRPRGDDRMTTGIEPFAERGSVPPPGVWGFYAYWAEMKISADGKYWGNGLHPVTPQPVPRGTWQSVEIMFKANSSPDRADGELALWLDGRLVAHFRPGVPRDRWTGMGFRLVDEGGEPFEGFRWRTSDALKVNFFWLLHYVTERAFERSDAYAKAHPDFPIDLKESTVFFDEIVVATRYIGPIAPPR